MKQIVLPNREMRLLANNLQVYNKGYTIAEIRLLDKVILRFNTALKLYDDNVVKLENSLKEEKDNIKIEEIKKNIEDEDIREITCVFEDPEFNFVKSIWGQMAGFRGTDDVRSLIIKIDNAIQAVSEPIFKN
jgi:hypothetical protein